MMPLTSYSRRSADFRFQGIIPVIKKILAFAAFDLLLTVLVLQAAPQSNSVQPPAELPGMAYVPGGEFWMGRIHMFKFDELNWTARDRLDDQPAHIVALDAFYMDKYEVTNADYARFAEATSHKRPWQWKDGKIPAGRDKWPVYNVDWNDSAAYCAWAGKRLPTEAEWEKAARGGLDRKLYSWGDELGAGGGGEDEEAGPAKKKARYAAPDGPVAVGSYDPNGYGLYDMTGNVWEWVADWYERDYYGITPSKNPKGTETGTYRVIRGGGWTSTEQAQGAGYRSLLGVHYRNYAPPSQISNALGFRCAKDAVQKTP